MSERREALIAAGWADPAEAAKLRKEHRHDVRLMRELVERVAARVDGLVAERDRLAAQLAAAEAMPGDAEAFERLTADRDALLAERDRATDDYWTTVRLLEDVPGDSLADKIRRVLAQLAAAEAMPGDAEAFERLTAERDAALTVVDAARSRIAAAWRLAVGAWESR